MNFPVGFKTLIEQADLDIAHLDRYLVILQIRLRQQHFCSFHSLDKQMIEFKSNQLSNTIVDYMRVGHRTSIYKKVYFEVLLK